MFLCNAGLSCFREQSQRNFSQPYEITSDWKRVVNGLWLDNQQSFSADRLREDINGSLSIV